MKVSIDSNVCVGHGLCFMRAPEVFAPDDDGFGHVRGDGEVNGTNLAGAKDGVASCPERAITLGE